MITELMKHSNTGNTVIVGMSPGYVIKGWVTEVVPALGIFHMSNDVGEYTLNAKYVVSIEYDSDNTND